MNSRKENKPKNCAMGMAPEIGIKVLTEELYDELQELGKFDTKTLSWLKTPAEIRKLSIDANKVAKAGRRSRNLTILARWQK